MLLQNHLMNYCLLRTIQKIVEQFRHKKHRNSTVANYYAIWKKFNQFFIKLDDKPATWEDRIVLFMGFLINDNKKSTTIKCYISAITAILQYVNIRLNLDEALLASLTRACCLNNETIKTRLFDQKWIVTGAY